MSSDPSQSWRYEAAIQEIESIIQAIESGQLDLETVVQQFHQASRTLETCRSFLQAKQAQVDLVIEQLADPPTPPADPEEDEDLEF